ncbi:hypothetical protein ACFL6H_05170, partial [Candidatus Latescibacterota bacterium]
MKDPAEVLKENPGSIIFARYAEELARNGNIDEALEILSSGINANPNYATGYSVLAEININQGLHEAAIEHLEKALGIEPQSPKDLLNLGKYFIDSQPEKAKEYLWKANRYEPESDEALEALNKVLSIIGDEGVDKDSVFSEAKDVEQPIEESADESEDSAISSADLLQPIDIADDMNGVIEESSSTDIEQESETGDPFEEMLGDVSASDDIETPDTATEAKDETADSEETVSDELTEFSEPDDLEESIPETLQDESDESLPSDMEKDHQFEETDEEIPDESSELEIDLMSEKEDVISEKLGDEEVSEESVPPEEAPEMTDVSADSEKTVSEVPPEENDVSMPVDTEEAQPSEEIESEAEEFTDQAVSEEDTSSDEEELLQELASITDDEEVEEEEEDDEVAEISEEIPGYSEMLGKDTPIEYSTPDINISEAGVLEIDDENSEYDVSKFEHDTSDENSEEPVLTDEERAELKALEESPTGDKKNIESVETVSKLPEESELSGISEESESDSTHDDSDNISTENLYKDLSKDEIDVLSETETESDDEDNHLEIETNEGIDYSDILYGKEPSIESDDFSSKTTDDIPETPPEDAAGEEMTPEKEIEDFAASDFDVDDISENSSFADNIISDVADSPDIEEITDDINIE